MNKDYFQELCDQRPEWAQLIFEKLFAAGFYDELTLIPQTPTVMLEEIRKMGNPKHQEYILQHPNCDSEFLQQSLKSKDKNLIKMVTRNPNVSDEARAQLALEGFTLSPKGSSYYPYGVEHVGSNFLFPVAHGKAYPELPREIVEFLYELGHPYSMVDANSQNYEAEISESSFNWLRDREYLHRLFWLELHDKIESADFAGFSGYKSNLLFLKHPILSRIVENEFNSEEFEYFAGTLDGDLKRDWFTTTYSISLERSIDFLIHFGDGFEVSVENSSTLEDLYPHALACLFPEGGMNEDQEKFGATANNDAKEEILDAGLEYAESGDLDVTVAVNPNWTESLRWSKLQNGKQRQLLQLLVNNLSSKETHLAKDAEYFLGCMAIHPDTPSDILSELQALNNTFINEILESR